MLPSPATILVTEDDGALREALVDTLEVAGYQVLAVGSAEDALATLQHEAVDLVVSDVNMPGMDGHALLDRLRDDHPQVPVVLMTAYAAVERAVEAMRRGAVDYLVKPFQLGMLLDVVQQTLGGRTVADGPVAESPAGRAVFDLATRVADTDASVLLLGESGVGKEVLSRWIHAHSTRVDGPFVALNCAAIPEQMLEAVMFGHEKGAFTGAVTSAPGKFEQADGGTLLLDEISEMDLALQAKLLRVLQEREVERVGGRRTIHLDVRVIATSNRDLQAAVADGSFREDLYYRLSVFPLQVPALRERAEDILPLARQLLARHARRMGREAPCLDGAAEAALLGHGWPGNIRELDNVVQRALILQRGSLVSAMDLHLDAPPERALDGAATRAPAQLLQASDTATASPLSNDLRDREFDLILRTLRDLRGSRRATARTLGISERTLRYKLQRMREAGIDVDRACA